MTRVKYEHQIQIGEKPWTLAAVIVRRRINKEKLMRAQTHVGSAADAGHYKCYVRHLDTLATWWLCDDSEITRSYVPSDDEKETSCLLFYVLESEERISLRELRFFLQLSPDASSRRQVTDKNRVCSYVMFYSEVSTESDCSFCDFWLGLCAPGCVGTVIRTVAENW